MKAAKEADKAAETAKKEANEADVKVPKDIKDPYEEIHSEEEK